jgi:hypothetical protein
MTADVGLADLARCLAALKPGDGRALELVIGMLGLELPVAPAPQSLDRPRPDAGRTRLRAEARLSRDAEPPTPSGSVEPELPRLEPVGRDERRLATPWRAATPLEPFDPARHLAAPARRAPLFDPRWTRELLASLLATEVADGRLDEAAAIALIAAGRPLDPLPQLTRRSLRRGAQVLVDVGEGMEPFVDDAWDLVERIERIAGESNVYTYAFWDAPSRGLAPDLDAYAPPPPLTPVLALTDAGIGGPSPRIERGRAAEWLALAERLAERGSPLILIVPYRRDRWPDALRRLTLVEWDRRTAAKPV